MKIPSSTQGRSWRSKWWWIGGISLLYLLPLFSIRGAVDIFLKLDGIEGESTDTAHGKEIDVLAWSWGASVPITRNAKTADVGPGNAQDLSVTKYVDKASPKLLINAVTGKHIADGMLVVRKAGATPVEFFTYELTDLLVASLSTGGIAGEDRLTENVTFNFQSIKETYFITDGDGKTTGEKVEAFWQPEGGPLPNTAPTLSSIANTSTLEDTAKVVSFSIGDSETAVGSLSLTRGSDNQSVVPTGNIVFGGSGSSRTATITPAENAHGSATISIIVTDGGGLTVTRTFLLTVDPVNDGATISAIPSQVTNQDVPIDVQVTVGDVDDDVDNISIAAGWNPIGVLTSVVDLTGSGMVRMLRITPNPSASGIATVNVTPLDPDFAGTATQFSITVNNAIGPNAITWNGNGPGQIVSVAENTATGTEIGFIEVLDGPGTNHLLELTDDAGGRFRLAGEGNDLLEVVSGALLDFEDSSVHTVVIKATDAGNSSRVRSDAFTVQLTNVNERPEITGPNFPLLTQPDTPTVLSGISITDPDPNAGSATFVVVFVADHGTIDIDDSGALAGKVSIQGSEFVITAPLDDINAVLADTGLVYQSDPAFTGTEGLVIAVDDQGATGSGGSLVNARGFQFEVGHTAVTAYLAPFFTPEQRADPAISGLSGHGDNDTLPNLAEYGLGSDPTDTASGEDLIETLETTEGDDTYPTLRFQRRISDPQLVIEVQVATNLSNWETGAGFVVVEKITPVDSDFEIVTIRSAFPLGTKPNQQIRIRFSILPSS